GPPRRHRARRARLRRDWDQLRSRGKSTSARGDTRMSTVDEAVAAIRAGEPVVLPFDTVYGLAADASSEGPVRRLYALKGCEASRPTALVARDVDYVLECVPELGGRAEAIARELLPGPFTRVVPNPAHRYAWL